MIDFKDTVGIAMTVSGFLDAFKYVWEGQAIIKAGTAAGHSRKFINVAIINDVVRICYLLFWNRDLYLFLSALMAIVCMVYMYWQIYQYYPYETYPRPGQKRPPLWIYIVNSFVPNNRREHL